MERDPAAQNPWEVAPDMPGHAVWGYRVARGLEPGTSSPRVIQNSTLLHEVDIHPAATWDAACSYQAHAKAIVLGKTALAVGEDVLIYHQVTLGGTSAEAEPSSHSGRPCCPWCGSEDPWVR